jgi:KH/beta-lactamase-domain protein
MKKEELFSEIEKKLPKNAMISDTVFEGANVVLYTKNRDFFRTGDDIIKDIVNHLKKRVKLRADESLLLAPEKTEEFIKKLIPPEAELTNIWFETKRSIVVVEAERPGLAIGRSGENISKIKDDTFWTPRVRRAPAVKSDIVDTIRMALYQESDYRRKFLNKLGERIYSEWERDNKYWIRMSCLGSCREVGRSCFLLQTPESKLLIDCGVNVASKDEPYPYLEAPEVNLKSLDGVVITHAHLDHSGFLPYLFKYGFKGPVYLTEPTRDIMTLLNVDYIDISQREGKKTIYTIKDIKEMIKHTVTMDYNVVTDISPDLRMTLLNAGHVLGSAMVHLNIGNGFHNLLYTGDMKYDKTKLLPRATTSFQRLETLFIESTYGGRKDVQPSREECEDFLLEIIRKTGERGGKVLIPVLGVGRSQEIIMILDEMMRKKKLVDVPIYIDGIVWDITAINTAYIDYMNDDVKGLLFNDNYNPFTAGHLKRVGSQKERMKVIEEGGPCVILATSGMLVGGPSVEYLRHLASDSRNSLVFVSYQGEGSLGRTIQKGVSEVPLEANNGKNELLKINMETYTIEGFSGHSDRKQLMAFISRLNPRPRRIVFVHGESSKCLDMASSIHKNFRIETSAPRNLDVLRIR